MKKRLITVLILLFLAGCHQIITEDLSSVNRVHIILNEEADNLNQSLVVIEDPSSIEELVHILETAKICRLVRWRGLTLPAPGIFPTQGSNPRLL